jgi:hypothetical protein
MLVPPAVHAGHDAVEFVVLVRSVLRHPGRRRRRVEGHSETVAHAVGVVARNLQHAGTAAPAIGVFVAGGRRREAAEWREGVARRGRAVLLHAQEHAAVVGGLSDAQHAAVVIGSRKHRKIEDQLRTREQAAAGIPAVAVHTIAERCAAVDRRLGVDDGGERKSAISRAAASQEQGASLAARVWPLVQSLAPALGEIPHRRCERRMLATPAGLAAALDLDDVALRVARAGVDPNRPPLLLEAHSECERTQSHGSLPGGRGARATLPDFSTGSAAGSDFCRKIGGRREESAGS